MNNKPVDTTRLRRKTEPPETTWTRSLAKWNTFATVAGAGASWAAVLLIIYLELLK